MNRVGKKKIFMCDNDLEKTRPYAERQKSQSVSGGQPATMSSRMHYDAPETGMSTKTPREPSNQED